MLLFFVSIVGQALTGWKEHNEDIVEKGGSRLELSSYLQSGHFLQATFENWESEFLQMALFVVLSIFLRQKGSSESKPEEGDEPVDREPVPSPDAPWPVNKGGIYLQLYKHSLSIALFLLFIFSFIAHFYGSWKDFNDEQLLKHKPLASKMEFIGEPKFWFESFQNYQSEFISVAAIIFLSVYLRQKGSAQSKPVDAPHDETE
jgi:hypothetical protein